VADSLTEGLRDGIIDLLDDRPHTAGSYLATLITCPWCAGMWVSLVAAPLVWFCHDNPVMLCAALALAFSQFTGMTASVGR
jgi:fatty acid desaturase